ncbi:Hypothetical protein PHPALM_5271 [Phytophthora palmivora]|uniref:Uncharacterized protein n=1 Tax=Phytophthora palmivora TaxID=4796 RepID=A0A2P4YHS8_9STRA|nr:Hypothetical protein PHPALM_5271 [Phytophthora palmivora]
MADDLKPDPVTLTYYVPIGNEENEDRVKITITTFGSGDTVEWLTWLKSFERLIRLKGWGEDGPTLFLNARIVLRDMALDIFNAARGVQGATPENFNTVMKQVAREFLVQDAREYLIDMIRNRRKTRDVSVTNHLASMRQLATLVTTPPENDALPSEKSLMYHFRKSMPLEWQTKYEESDREAATLSGLARYFTRLEMNSERKEALEQPARKEGARTTNPPKQQRGKPKVSAKPLKPATGTWCSHHRTNTHSYEECHYQQKKRAEELNYCEVPDDYDELNVVTAGSSSVETTTECKSETIVAEQLPYGLIIGRDLIVDRTRSKI